MPEINLTLTAGNNIAAGFPKHRHLVLDALALTHRCIPGKAIEPGLSRLNVNGPIVNSKTP